MVVPSKISNLSAQINEVKSTQTLSPGIAGVSVIVLIAATFPSLPASNVPLREVPVNP